MYSFFRGRTRLAKTLLEFEPRSSAQVDATLYVLRKSKSLTNMTACFAGVAAQLCRRLQICSRESNRKWRR